MVWRKYEDEDVETVLDEVEKMWAVTEDNPGRKACEELLYRWGYLPEDYWEIPESRSEQFLGVLPGEKLIATVAKEADERGLSHNLYMEPHSN